MYEEICLNCKLSKCRGIRHPCCALAAANPKLHRQRPRTGNPPDMKYQKIAIRLGYESQVAACVGMWMEECPPDKIRRTFGCTRTTVRRWLRAGGIEITKRISWEASS